MYRTSIQSADGYGCLRQKLQSVFRFLRNHDLEKLPVGSIPLEEGATAHVQDYTTVPSEEGRFEAHDRCYDIQFVVRGEEIVEVADRRRMNVSIPYAPENDVAFYGEPDRRNSVYLEKGDMVVLSPEEAHKPRVCAGKPCRVKKIVIKIPV